MKPLSLKPLNQNLRLLQQVLRVLTDAEVTQKAASLRLGLLGIWDPVPELLRHRLTPPFARSIDILAKTGNLFSFPFKYSLWKFVQFQTKNIYIVLHISIFYFLAPSITKTNM